MALNDSAVVVAAVGYVFVGDPGTTAPTPAELAALDTSTFSGLNSGWSQIGHTSREALPEFDTSGGDTKVKGTWQKQRLREIQSGDPNVDSVKLTLEQWDPQTMELFYGTDAAGIDGVFGVSGDYVPVEKALLIIIVDSDVKLGFYAAKAGITRDGAVKLPLDDFAGMPIKASFLDYPGARLYDWINEDLFGSGSTSPSETLDLGGATGGTFTLKVAGTLETGSITVSGIDATAIKTAIVAVDDGYTSADWTVTGSSSPYTITGPVIVTLGTDSSSGGTGVVVTPA